MVTVILALGLVLLSVAGMAIGVLLRGRPIEGTCGSLCGVKNATCSACPRNNGRDR